MSNSDLNAKQITLMFGGSWTFLIFAIWGGLLFNQISNNPSALALWNAGHYLIILGTFLGFVLLIAFFTAPAAVAAYASEAKGYKPLPWFLLGLLCSWGAVLGGIAMPSKYFRF